jgi:cobalt-zinc-cadmium resistance protein CzcA
MIDQFVGFCLHRRIAIFILAGLLSGFGVYAWETLSVEAYPELGDVAAQVTTQIPGLAADALLEHLRLVIDHGFVSRRL